MQQREGIFVRPLELDRLRRSHRTMFPEDSHHPGKTRRALADEEAFAVALPIFPVFAMSIMEGSIGNQPKLIVAGSVCPQNQVPGHIRPTAYGVGRRPIRLRHAAVLW